MTSFRALLTAVFIPLLLSACTKVETVEWHMVDVNFHRGLQGDAHVIVDNGRVALIDAGYGGPIGDRLATYISELGIDKIDKFIISHPHRDHYEGIRNVLKAGIVVEDVYYNSNTSVADCCFKADDFSEVLKLLTNQGAVIHDVHESQIIKLGKTSFRVVLAAKSSEIEGRKIDLNDVSIVMRWEAFSHSVLFAGDLNSVGGKYMADKRSIDISADILKVPHHGVTGIAPKEFFERVAPKLLMFPDPNWARASPRGAIAFGYASSSGVKSCSNSTNGTVKIVFRTDAVIAKPERPSATCDVGVIFSKNPSNLK